MLHAQKSGHQAIASHWWVLRSFTTSSDVPAWTEQSSSEVASEPQQTMMPCGSEHSP